MLATYHTHTDWSDGRQTLDDMLSAAMRLGVHELGVSDHWVLHPEGTRMKWAMAPDALAEYVHAVQALQARSFDMRGPVVRLGLEVDWFPAPEDHAHSQQRILARYPFDYLIGSVHEVDGFMIDGSPASWQQLTQDQINHLHRRYWQNMRTLGERGGFDIVAHIDLAKKFAFHPTCDVRQDISEALDAIAAASNRPVVELNTAGWHKPCNDAYPAVEILRMCRAREIDVTISSDAHQPEHLLRDFDRAAARLAEVGYARVARFSQREKRFEALDDAVPASRVG